jgi:hypothetical protein
VTRPPTGQGPFQKGERLTAAKLNEWVLQKPSVSVFGEGHSEGGVVAVDGRESMYLRLTGKNTNTPIQYAWKRVSRLPNGTWQDLTHTGNTTNDYAVEINNANLTVNTTTVYQAERSVTTGEWLFQQTGGTSNGTFSANSSETAVMILGTYASYKDCPNVPASPPTTYVDVCNGTRGTELCVPAYAYAVYQRCGYIWNKIGDTRTYQVWANEMNGGTISAYRRMYIPRWGGNMTESGPDPDSDCMGLAVMGYSSQGALTCSCPPCLSTPPEGVELCLKFRTIVRPEDPEECAGLVSAMDAEDAWDREYVVPLTPASGFCSVGGETDDAIFSVGWDYQDGASLSCDWGPDVFDPCDPCEHWGRILANITANYGGTEPNCGAGVWTGEFKAKDLCALICDCGNGPIEPVDQKHCQGCGNNADPPAIWNAIVEGSVELICCSDNEAFYGGNATSSFSDGCGSGNSTSSFTEAIYGGDS